MSQKSESPKPSSKRLVRDIRRATRKQYSAEEKIRIVLDGLRGEHSIAHIRGAPCHPQTQGKIERWHQTLKNRIMLENYYFPSELEAQIGGFIDYYNNRR